MLVTSLQSPHPHYCVRATLKEMSFADKIPKSKIQNWTKLRSTKSQIGQNPEWTKSRIGQNPEWTKSRMDKIPNEQNPE